MLVWSHVSGCTFEKVRSECNPKPKTRNPVDRSLSDGCGSAAAPMLSLRHRRHGGTTPARPRRPEPCPPSSAAPASRAMRWPASAAMPPCPTSWQGTSVSLRPNLSISHSCQTIIRSPGGVLGARGCLGKPREAARRKPIPTLLPHQPPRAAIDLTASLRLPRSRKVRAEDVLSSRATV
jgi:hypothetical protein